MLAKKWKLTIVFIIAFSIAMAGVFAMIYGSKKDAPKAVIYPPYCVNFVGTPGMKMTYKGMKYAKTDSTVGNLTIELKTNGKRQASIDVPAGFNLRREACFDLKFGNRTSKNRCFAFTLPNLQPSGCSDFRADFAPTTKQCLSVTPSLNNTVVTYTRTIPDPGHLGNKNITCFRYLNVSQQERTECVFGTLNRAKHCFRVNHERLAVSAEVCRTFSGRLTEDCQVLPLPLKLCLNC
jgi:hypothetical protein